MLWRRVLLNDLLMIVIRLPILLIVSIPPLWSFLVNNLSLRLFLIHDLGVIRLLFLIEMSSFATSTSFVLSKHDFKL